MAWKLSIREGAGAGDPRRIDQRARNSVPGGYAIASQPRYSLPTVPDALGGLVDLALDMRWSWSHSADELWRHIEPELWEATHNPWHILQTVAQTKLDEFAADPEFLRLVDQHVQARREALEAPSWFEQTLCTEMSADSCAPSAPLKSIAYFSMEFGLTEALPIYSGGLGILAGDFLKAASDLGIPAVGVGLLWQQGYFRQALDAKGDQIEFFPFNDPGQLPMTPLRDSQGEWVSVPLRFPRRAVHLRVWEVRAGRVKLYLLDTNDLMNSPADRGITSELYGGGPEMRLQQEMILGIGGWRVLRLLGIEPEVCHLNEGHAAFAVLERARSYMQDRDVDFDVALTATRAGNLFTTHTPVEAGFDRFAPALMHEYLSGYAEDLGIDMQRLLDLGRCPGCRPAAVDTDRAAEPFNMAFLAIRGSSAVNGVSRLHGEVSRDLFQPLFPRWPRREVPVGHITNGVHVPSWDSPEADALWTKTCGKGRWLGGLEGLGDLIRQVSDEELWAFRDANRRKLIEVARDHVTRQGPIAGSLESLGSDVSCLCDPVVLTLGFARRFTSYKRVNLLLHDPDRLERLLCGDDSRVQLVLAGKSHPADAAGKAMVRQWTEFIRRCVVRPHVVFLVDYDMGIAEHLVHGVDVWINTPRRPWEASGTSGMKVLANGGLNLSEIDGWWAEAYSPEVGWALGDGLEHDSDPAWDAIEAERLYDLLENQIVPEFYDRDDQGIPRRWIARVRESMARLAPYYSTNRMLEEYLRHYYIPGAAAYRSRTAVTPEAAAMATRTTGPVGMPALAGSPGTSSAVELEIWRKQVREHWHEVEFVDYVVESREGPPECEPQKDCYSFVVDVELGTIPPDAVRVELYAEPIESASIYGTGPVSEVPPNSAAAASTSRVAPAEIHLLARAPRERQKEASVATVESAPTVQRYAAVLPAIRPHTDYTPRVVPYHPFARVPLEAHQILWYR